MSLYTVTINSGAPREVYLDLAGVDAYANDGAGAGPDAYRALVDANDADGRSRLIVQGTRFFNALPWKGERTTPAVGGTTLAWPRTGLVYADGSAVPSTSTPQEVLDGFCELVMLFAVDNAASSAKADQANNIRALGAGSASIEYFATTNVEDGSALVLPPIVDRFVGRWLGGTAASAGGSIRGGAHSGGNSGSYMDRCRQYARDEEW